MEKCHHNTTAEIMEAQQAAQLSVDTVVEWPEPGSYSSMLTRGSPASSQTKLRRLEGLLPVKLAHIAPILIFQHNPWMEKKCMNICPLLEGSTSWLDSGSVKKEVYLQRIRELCDPTVIYKGGSATCGIMKGRIAIVVSEREILLPRISHTQNRKRCAVYL